MPEMVNCRMKAILILFILAIPFSVDAQTELDHIKQVEKFVKFYNDRKTGSICSLFPNEKTTGIRCDWQYADKDRTYDIYGVITSFKFMGTEENNNRKVALFQLKSTSKGEILLSASLNSEKKFTIFLLK